MNSFVAYRLWYALFIEKFPYFIYKSIKIIEIIILNGKIIKKESFVNHFLPKNIIIEFHIMSVIQ